SPLVVTVRAGVDSQSGGAHEPGLGAVAVILHHQDGGIDTAPSSARTRSSCTPAARSCRKQNAGERQPLAWRRASPFFCQEILQRRIVEHGVRQKLLQPTVLAL